MLATSKRNYRRKRNCVAYFKESYDDNSTAKTKMFNNTFEVNQEFTGH